MVDESVTPPREPLNKRLKKPLVGLSTKLDEAVEKRIGGRVAETMRERLGTHLRIRLRWFETVLRRRFRRRN